MLLGVQAVGYHEPRRPCCRCGRIFFKFTRKQVRREKVPWGWTPSTEWHCVSLVLICAAESDSTLYSLLATDRRSVGLQHRGSPMTCRCFMTSVPGCRRQLVPFTYIGERDTLESEVGEAPFGHQSTWFYMTMQESLLTRCNPEPHMHATKWSTTGRVTRAVKQ